MNTNLTPLEAQYEFQDYNEVSKRDTEHWAALITFNNPEEYGYNETHIDNVLRNYCNARFFCRSKEMADSENNTIHIHVFAQFYRPVSFSTLKHHFYHAHFDLDLRGTPQDCYDYVKKINKHSNKAHTQIQGTFYEEGTLYTFNKPRIDWGSELQSINEELHYIRLAILKVATGDTANDEMLRIVNLLKGDKYGRLNKQ